MASFGAASLIVQVKPVFGSISGETGDATAPLFDLSPENFIFYANKDLMKSSKGEKRQDVMINSRVESRTFDSMSRRRRRPGARKDRDQNETRSREHRFLPPQRSAIGGDKPVELAVQHSSGSLDAFHGEHSAAKSRDRVWHIVPVGGAIAAIIISAHASENAGTAADRFCLDRFARIPHAARGNLFCRRKSCRWRREGRFQVSRYGDLIKGEGKKLSAMVEQILEFAGANSGRQTIQFAPIRRV